MTELTHPARSLPRPGELLAGLAGAALLAGAILAVQEKALFGLAGAILFCFFVRWPALGLYLTTALLLLTASATVFGDLRVHVPVTAAKLCGAVAFAAWALRVVVRRERLRFTPSIYILLAFFAWSALGVLLSETWEYQWAEWIRLGTLLAYFLLAVNVLDTRERVTRFVMLILFCGMALAGFAVLQYFVPAWHLEVSSAAADLGVRTEGAYIDYGSLEGGPAVRVSGGTGHSNWLALLILTVLPINAYLFMAGRTRTVRALALCAVALEVAALVFTFTRTGFLVGCIVLLLLFLRNLVRFTPQRFTAVALAIFLVWFLLPQPYKERVLDPTQYTRSESVRNRMQLQDSAWEQFTGHPVFGVGLGGYGPRLLDDNTRVARIMRWFVEEHNWPPQFIGPHNMYMQVAAETGVVGLTLFCVFFVVLIRELRGANRIYRELGDDDGAALTSTLEVGLVAFLVCGVFLHALTQKIWWMVAATAAAASLHASLLKPPVRSANGHAHDAD